MAIRSLKSGMNRELALRRLAPPEIPTVLQSWLSGPLRGIAEFYIPYRLYKIIIHDRNFDQVRYYAVDAASGTLDPYEFQVLPAAEKWTEVDTRNCHPVRLPEKETRKIAIEKVRRGVFSRGFFRLSAPQLTAELLMEEFYLPYWAGFYGDEQNVTLKVMNAVRQTMEGSKVRQMLKSWLLEKAVADQAVCGVPTK